MIEKMQFFMGRVIRVRDHYLITPKVSTNHLINQVEALTKKVNELIDEVNRLKKEKKDVIMQ